MAVLLGVLGGAAAFALAARGAPPAPQILSHPVDRTRARPAVFKFTDAQPNVTFTCSLDGKRYKACASPSRYGVLPPGHHVFRVKARSSSGALSKPTSYSWKIDLAAPQVKVKFPARKRIYGATAWRTGCKRKHGGICGTVFAPSGLRHVILWIKQNKTHRWWNGHAFKARHAIWKRAVLTHKRRHGKRVTRAQWFFRLSLPKPDGKYTVLVRASDRIGNLTRLRTQKRVGWTIDTALAAPTITSTPGNPTTATTGTFTFTDVTSGVQYQCNLDNQGWQPCTSPISYNGLNVGTHTFEVRATQGSHVSPPAQYTWTVTSSGGGGGPFTITSRTIAPLYPGAAASTIPLTLANPNGSSITVTSVTITLDPSSLPAGCPASGYKITQPTIPSAGVTVAAKGSVTLPDQGATTGSIQMLDTHTNQNACQSGKLKLNYSGSAHS